MRVRGFLVSKVLPFALLLVAGGIATGVAVTLVYAKGVAYMASVPGLLLQIPIVVTLALVTRAVLIGVKKLPREKLGFVSNARAARDLGLSTLLGIGVVVVGASALWAAGLAPFTWSSTPPSVIAVVIGLLGFVVNAALQQLTLQGSVLAVGTDTKLSPGAAAFGCVMFTLAHLDPQATALSLVNVFLFGAVTTLLFFRRPAPSYAAAIGFHGGVNFALVFVLGATSGALAQNTLGLLRWPPGERLVLGGAGGYDAGLMSTVISLVLGTVLLRARRRSVVG